MAESHSTQNGGELYVISTELASNDVQKFAFVNLRIPLPFDFDKMGKRLLNNIKSAANLFEEEKNVED